MGCVIIVECMDINVLFIRVVVECCIIDIIMVIVLGYCDVIVGKCCDFGLIILKGVISCSVVICGWYCLRYFDWIRVCWCVICVKDLYVDILFILSLCCFGIGFVVIFLCYGKVIVRYVDYMGVVFIGLVYVGVVVVRGVNFFK